MVLLERKRALTNEPWDVVGLAGRSGEETVGIATAEGRLRQAGRLGLLPRVTSPAGLGGRLLCFSGSASGGLVARLARDGSWFGSYWEAWCIISSLDVSLQHGTSIRGWRDFLGELAKDSRWWHWWVVSGSLTVAERIQRQAAEGRCCCRVLQGSGSQHTCSGGLHWGRQPACAGCCCPSL